MASEFEVSRGGTSGVVLTALPGTPRGSALLADGAVLALQQYELTVVGLAESEYPKFK
jgi:hypothetical protein